MPFPIASMLASDDVKDPKKKNDRKRDTQEPK
jgi:hypothetical protein